MTEMAPRVFLRRPRRDLRVLLLPLAALLLVGAFGLLGERLVLDALLAQPGMAALASDVRIRWWLLYAAAAVVGAGLTLLALYLYNRPIHELAESIALSGLAELPVPVPAGGSPALRLVAARYNQLVAAVARTGEQLRQSAERQRQRADAVEDFSDLVLANVPSGIVAVDADGQVVRINTAACQILGQQQEQIVGRSLAEAIGAEHPVARAAGSTLVRDEVTSGDDETAQVLGISSAPVRDQRDLVVGSVVIFADLTDLRRLERQLEMKQRLASLGEVAAGLAHEIRNPLGALRGFVELLERRLAEPERARPLLEKILREVEALSTVVGDFLAYARPAPPLRQPIALAPLLGEALEVGLAAAGRPALAASIDVQPADLTLVADAAQLRRALVNFVINACQALAGSGRLLVGAQRAGSQVRLYVEDDGPGVPPALHGKVLTPFFTTKRAGTGLGLAVAQQIAIAHGGELVCESPPAGGARFVLCLPVSGETGRGILDRPPANS
ncbi:MAG: PAS domain-containing protein [Deltaproteobacteria bacterium]|nr:PAS domain-containing protein [Deltaproteobacteria bacterium]